MLALKRVFELINSNSKFKKAAQLILILFVVASVFLYTQKPKSDSLKDSSKILGSNTISLEQVNEITDKVRKLADIPSETPNVATITDAATVNNQTFFTKAQNGDKVLIFQNAKRAVLYRPSTNKIIEYTTIVVSQETSTPAQTNVEASASPSGSSPQIKFVSVTQTPVPSEIQSQAQ